MEKKTKLVYDFLNGNYERLKELPETEALNEVAQFAATNKINDWFTIDSQLVRYESMVKWFWLVRRLRNNIHLLRELQEK